MPRQIAIAFDLQNAIAQCSPFLKPEEIGILVRAATYEEFKINLHYPRSSTEV